MIRPILAASAAVLALAACNNRGNETTAEKAAENAVTETETVGNEAMEDLGNEMGEAGNETANAIAPAAVTSGADYAAAVAASDTYEIEAAKLAQKNSKNADIRAYAKMLETDHTKSSADLKTAASEATPPITVTPKMTDDQQDDLKDLGAASTEDFDDVYIDQQIDAHEDALAKLQAYAKDGDVPSLKKHAAATATVIEKHLARARELDQSKADDTAE
jgi:putative membrane protein